MIIEMVTGNYGKLYNFFIGWLFHFFYLRFVAQCFKTLDHYAARPVLVLRLFHFRGFSRPNSPPS
jgi:hypothetical protein